MSRETVIALRRFTEKVAAGRRPFSDDDSPPPAVRPARPLPRADAPSAEIFDDEPAKPAAPSPPPAANYDSAVGEESGADRLPPLRLNFREKRTPAPMSPEAFDAEERAWQSHPAGGPAAANASWLSTLAGYMPPATTSMGVGLGGLGAYGLARLLQSEEDRKKNKFPWLATLLGAAGGGYLGHLFNDPAMQTQATQAYNEVAPRALRTESANADMDARDAAQLEPMAPTANTFGNDAFDAAQRGDSTPR